MGRVYKFPVVGLDRVGTSTYISWRSCEKPSASKYSLVLASITGETACKMRLFYTTASILLAIGPAANAGDPPPFERMMRIPVTDSSQISYQGNDGDLRAVILSRLEGKRLATVRQIVAAPPRTVLGAFATTFYHLGPGEYTLTAVDDVGNASTIPFRISDLAVSARVWPSRSAGARQSIRADAASKAGVDHFNLYSLSDPNHIAVLARQDVPESAQTGGVTFSQLAAGAYEADGVQGARGRARTDCARG